MKQAAKRVHAGSPPTFALLYSVFLFFFWLIFDSEDDNIPPERRFSFNGLHYLIEITFRTKYFYDKDRGTTILKIEGITNLPNPSGRTRPWGLLNL
jgi:hypothetical protein